MILAAYGIRKAYKKHEAKKAHKQSMSSSNDINNPSSELQRTVSSSSSFRQSRDGGHPVNGGIVNYSGNTNSSVTQVDPSSPSTRTDYSASIYSQSGITDPLDEIRHYQAYIQRQSHDFSKEIEPPAYEYAIQPPRLQSSNRTASANAPETATERLNNEVCYDHRSPVGGQRITELDNSSETSTGTTHRPNSPLQRSFAFAETEPRSAISELSAEDVPVLMPMPLQIRKSLDEREEQRVELPAENLQKPAARKRQYQSDSGEEEDDDHKNDVAKQANSKSVEVFERDAF